MTITTTTAHSHGIHPDLRPVCLSSHFFIHFLLQLKLLRRMNQMIVNDSFAEQQLKQRADFPRMFVLIPCTPSKHILDFAKEFSAPAAKTDGERLSSEASINIFPLWDLKKKRKSSSLLRVSLHCDCERFSLFIYRTGFRW